MSKNQTEESRQTALQVRDSRVFAFMSELEKAANLPERIQTGVVKMLEKKIQYMMDWEIAEMISGSDLVPKDYVGKPQNVFLAVQTGRSLGLDEFQSVRHLYTVNGRTSVYGDMMLGLVKKHPDFDDIIEEQGELVAAGKDHGNLPKFAKCTVKRKNGKSDVVGIYTIEDAMKNPNFGTRGYQNAPGVWMRFGARMMKMRARSFALRDAFPDKLSGIYDEYEITEVAESRDITSQVQDLSKQKATDALNDMIKDDIQEEATEPETTIETEEQESLETKGQSKAQPEPENLPGIKAAIASLRQKNLVDDETHKQYVEAGSTGQWDVVEKIHDRLMNSYVVKLAGVVDLPEYKQAIESLIVDGTVKKPTSKQNDFRTSDEAIAQSVFEEIEIRKGFIDSAAKESAES